MHPIGSEKIDQVVEYLQSRQIPHELLDKYVNNTSEIHCFYLLINSRILYVYPVATLSSIEKKVYLSNALSEALRSKASFQNITWIIDSTGIPGMFKAGGAESRLIDIDVIESSDAIFHVFNSLGKDLLKGLGQEYGKTIKNVPEFHHALDLALNIPGKERESSDEEDLSSLNQEELIHIIQKLRQEKSEEKTILEDRIKNLLDSFSQHTQVMEVEKGDPLAPVYGVMSNTLHDFHQVKDELEKLKENFHQHLHRQLGETFYQEPRLKSIFDSLDSIVWYVSKDFRLMAFNKKFSDFMRSISGITPEIGMDVLETFPDFEKFELFKDRINIALRGKETTYTEKYRKNNVVDKVIVSKIFPVIFENEILGVACLSNDITESYFAKEKIKRNEKLLASVNKNISEAIYRSSSKEGLVYVNDAFVKMFGFSSKEEVYACKDILSIYANPEDRKQLRDLLIEKKHYTNVEVLYKRRSGETFTGLISSIHTVGENGISYYDGAIRDVTAIKLTREKLKEQNEQLKKLNSELDSFVYSASHDLKAPLNSVKGLLELAKNEQDKSKVDNYLHLIDRSIGKLDDFIQDIINLSRNVRQDVVSEAVDFEEVLSDIMENFRYLENFKKLEKIIEVDQQSSFSSDKRRLVVVLNNLISNAARYYNPSIEVPFMKISIKSSVEQAVIIISDNGIGIEKQYLEKIFEMFFRASGNSIGSGIGLYIVKETIEKLGGSIEVQSQVGMGSTFKMIIPNQSAQA